MFEHFGFIEKFGISKVNLQKFLLEVCRKYRRVPFHNMTHAFNVSHACFFVILVIKRERLEDALIDEENALQGKKDSQDDFPTTRASLIPETLFTDLDILAMLIACIGHDLDHPGLGNSYFSKAKDYRATAVSN